MRQALQACKKIDSISEELEVERFQRRFYFPTLKAPEDYQLFLQTCLQDQEIDKFIMEHLDEVEKTYFDTLKKIRFLKKKLFSKEGSVILGA